MFQLSFLVWSIAQDKEGYKMAIRRGGPARDETHASNSIRENVDVDSDDEGENATETMVFRIRGLSSLPPPIPNEADRPLIQPKG
uniref:Uncharacterized protein n=1 Tax=Oryza punctata TaxID=4537 RepID=A0A0E0KDW0_ORYPU